MILEKKLKIPAYVRRNIIRRFSLFREQSGTLAAEGLHVRESGDLLVCAEGRTQTRSLPQKPIALFCSAGMGHARFVYTDGVLENLDSGARYALSERPTSVLCFIENDAECYYVLTQSAFYALQEATVSESGGEAIGNAVAIEGAGGGVSAAVHFERVFVANGFRVSFSAPLAPRNRTIGVQDAGYIDLPAEGGTIQEIVSFDDKLILFRERGISTLYASGNTLKFRAESVPYACGNVKTRSVANCGKVIAFFTESGLYTFNGTACKRVFGCGAELISGVDAAVVADGKYYAAVTVKGERVLFCYDPEEVRGHFIRFSADLLAGGKELLFTEDEACYRLTAQGVGMREYELKTGQTTFGLSPSDKLLDGLMIDGTGRFRIEVRTRRGLARFARGSAGEYIRFPYPVRGVTFSVRLRSLSENASVRSVAFDIREARL